MSTTKLNTIPEILEDIRAGRMVVMMDDEERENEGDLVMAASKVRPEDINFMARFGRGLICLPLTRERCRQLQLPLMVNENQSRFATNFTVSIEAVEGITTGISAYDRAHTIRTAVKPDANFQDLSQPGHVFPLMAQPGGVLTRSGHTEASVDLAMLAGLEPAAVLVEILNEDGSMARRPELEDFAREHGLKIGTIADLIHYRMETEKSVEHVSTHDVVTDFGPFTLHTYRDLIEDRLHLALMRGVVSPEESFLVRVHVQNPLSDVLSIQRDDFGMPLRTALAQVDAANGGLVLVLGGYKEDDEILRQIQQKPEPAMKSNGDNQHSRELRTYGIGAQIIADLGIRKMRVLSAPWKLTGLAGFGLEVEEYIDTLGEKTEWIMKEISAPELGRDMSIAVVAARFNRFIVDQLVAGVQDALDRQGIEESRQALVWVPGAFELPLMADQLASSGKYDAVIALGAVVRGGTPHFDFVAGECASGLSEVSLDHGIPVTFGVLTTDTVEQALERAGTDEGNKGFDVAMTAIEMVETMRAVKTHLAGLSG